MRRAIPEPRFVAMLALACLAAAGLAGCGYTPARPADTALPAYRTDLDTCRTAAVTSVDQHNAKRGLTWIAGSVTRWTAIADATSICMSNKGWGRTRACTADELRQGDRTGGLIVTTSGIHCTDPATHAP